MVSRDHLAVLVILVMHKRPQTGSLCCSLYTLLCQITIAEVSISTNTTMRRRCRAHNLRVNSCHCRVASPRLCGAQRLAC